MIFRAGLAMLLSLGVISAARAAGIDAPNPLIASILSAISPQRIETRVRKLASFHTRHTLSETRSGTRGVGAARRWIKAELEDCSRATGGALRVEFDAYTQPPVRRVPQPVEIVNVVATLPGTQPGAQGRLYVVSGHYDSIPSDVMDPEGRAPGEPAWRHSRDVGNVTRYTLRGISKDNAVFAVVAVDRDGNASPASFAQPWRPKADRRSSR